MAKGNFKQAVGSNADINSICEVQGVVYVGTADTIYRVEIKGGKYSERICKVEELVFDYEPKAI
jgi:hypothetical protein